MAAVELHGERGRLVMKERTAPAGALDGAFALRARDQVERKVAETGRVAHHIHVSFGPNRSVIADCMLVSGRQFIATASADTTNDADECGIGLGESIASDIYAAAYI